MNRPIDVILATLLISPEIYLWVNLITFIHVWIDRFSATKKDGWANQYNAESGKTSSRIVQGILMAIKIIMIGLGFCVYYRDDLTSQVVQLATQPYIWTGWTLLTYLTIFATLPTHGISDLDAKSKTYSIVKLKHIS